MRLSVPNRCLDMTIIASRNSNRESLCVLHGTTAPINTYHTQHTTHNHTSHITQEPLTSPLPTKQSDNPKAIRNGWSGWSGWSERRLWLQYSQFSGHTPYLGSVTLGPASLAKMRSSTACSRATFNAPQMSNMCLQRIQKAHTHTDGGSICWRQNEQVTN